ncbi:MAG: polyphosphate kinase 1 [Bacteroidetes bacterium]|nr:MAG: polyphosphate kinase 1 [Bacteroidota bacterium]
MDTSAKYLINRELSWLSFNDRVLQEAQDANNPLIERFRFLGIYSNNMDEFFRVRVANARRMLALKNVTIEGFDGGPKELLEEIRKRVILQQKKFEQVYREISVLLEEKEIIQVNELNLLPEHKIALERFYLDELRHVIVPIILQANLPFPKLRDKSIYLAVKMFTDKKPMYALIEIPAQFPRIHQIEDEDKHYFIILDDIIRLHLESIFSIFEFNDIQAYTFKFTRDAELDLDDDLSISFIEKIEKSLKKRKRGEPVRFVYDSQMPVDLQGYLLKALNLTSGVNAISGGRYHNFKDFGRFPDFGNKSLIYEQRPPLRHPVLGKKRVLIKTILERDILLHFPYQQFDYIVDILREAAIDPAVESIKINVYRVTKNSQILSALMSAVSNGKEVVVFVELQARFDEENNLIWAQRLKDHGARVVYGYRNLKVHSKLFLITRENKGKKQRIAFVGTGNFHEVTAKVYTDLAILTAHKSITEEVDQVFNMLENSKLESEFKHLLVSPKTNRKAIVQLIQKEMDQVKKGNKGLIQIKMNNLVDSGIIQKLYEASQKGVKIQLLIRGICCLIPGVKGVSDNIEVISVVGRYLEHSRMMIFHNNGNPRYYITSADLMTRNLDKRIEVGIRVYQTDIQEELQFVFDSMWRDNCKARIVDQEQLNKYRKRDQENVWHAQKEMYHYYEDKLKAKIL